LVAPERLRRVVNLEENRRLYDPALVQLVIDHMLLGDEVGYEAFKALRPQEQSQRRRVEDPPRATSPCGVPSSSASCQLMSPPSWGVPRPQDGGWTEDPRLLIDVRACVDTLTLNRPGSRNALTSGLIVSPRQALTAAESSEAVDAIVLTGTDPGFCVGLDQHELNDGGGAFRIGRTQKPRAMLERRRHMPSTSRTQLP